jgi:hypothetical protein
VKSWKNNQWVGSFINQGVGREEKQDGAKEALINFQNKANRYRILNLRIVFGYIKNNFCSTGLNVSMR